MANDALSANKSPDSALIAGLVAGFAAAAMLALMFFILWRTREHPYVPAQPERIIPIREDSQVSTRNEYPIVNLGANSGQEKEGGHRPSRASSTSRPMMREASGGLT